MNIPKEINDRIVWSNRLDDMPCTRIKDIKHTSEQCEDCDIIVCDRTIQHKFYKYPKPHWRTKCSQCKRLKDPITGVYDIPDKHANNYYNSKKYSNFIQEDK